MNSWISLLALGAVYAALFYLWYAVKARRGVGGWLRKQETQREIHLIESFGVAPRTSLLLVEVRGQSLLVAQSPQGIQIVPLEKSALAPPVKGATIPFQVGA